MRLVVNHCVAGSALGQVPGPSSRGAGAMPAPGELRRGLWRRRRGCAAGLGSSGNNGGVGPALGDTRLLLTLVLCTFALKTGGLGSGAAQVPLAGHRPGGLPVHRTPMGSKPGGLCCWPRLEAIIRPIPEPSAPKEVITAALKAAAAFPVRGNNDLIRGRFNFLLLKRAGERGTIISYRPAGPDAPGHCRGPGQREVRGPGEDGSSAGRSGCQPEMHPSLDITGAMAAEQHPVPVNKRIGVCKKAAVGHKEESFEREQCLGLFSPDFHRTSGNSRRCPALHGAAWHCVPLHSSGFGFRARCSRFPSRVAAGRAQPLLSRQCRDLLASPSAPALVLP